MDFLSLTVMVRDRVEMKISYFEGRQRLLSPTLGRKGDDHVMNDVILGYRKASEQNRAVLWVEQGSVLLMALRP